MLMIIWSLALLPTTFAEITDINTRCVTIQDCSFNGRCINTSTSGKYDYCRCEADYATVKINLPCAHIRNTDQMTAFWLQLCFGFFGAGSAYLQDWVFFTCTIVSSTLFYVCAYISCGNTKTNDVVEPLCVMCLVGPPGFLLYIVLLVQIGKNNLREGDPVHHRAW